MLKAGKLYNQSIFGRKYIWGLLFCFTTLCSVKHASAQISPLAEGIKDSIILTYTYNDSVYVVHTSPFYRGQIGDNTCEDSVTVSCWNGTNWKHFPPIKISYYKRFAYPITAIAVHNDQIFLAGEFNISFANGDVAKGIIKFNGEEWEKTLFNCPCNFNNTALVFTDWNKQLYLAADVSNGSTRSQRCFVYKDNKWEPTLDSFSKKYEIKGIQMLIPDKDKLYAIGDFMYMKDTVEIRSRLAIWNGTYWNAVDSFALSMAGIRTILAYDYKIWFSLRYSEPITTFFWDGKKMITKSVENWPENHWDNGPYTRTIFTYRDSLWLVLNGKYKYEDPIRSYFFVWNGQNWQQTGINISDPMEIYFVNPTGKNLYLFGRLDKYKGIDLNHAGKLGIQSSVWGKVYYDKNNNCQPDSADLPVKDVTLQVTPGPYYVDTDDNGNYGIYLDSGKYSIKVINKKYRNTTCPVAGNINIDAKFDSIHTNNNFGIALNPDVQDLKVRLTGAIGWRARIGFTESYSICYENAGTTNAKGRISLLLDSAFTDFTAVPSPDYFVYPVAKWNFDSLDVEEKRCITFTARLDSTTQLSLVKMIASFDGDITWVDSTYENNTDTLRQRVVGAVDPNDKTSFPDNKITVNTRELRYQIRFQNTGTDTAYKITVIDTLDANLPVTGINVNAASHIYKLDIKNNVLRWTFDNILLPDSTTNEPLSHGFINYTAQIKPGLAIGTEIKNTAYIYFDYQKPVVTNTARSKMVEETNISIKTEKATFGKTLNIYPNPAANKVYFKNTGIAKKQLFVLNCLGQQLKTIALAPGEIESWGVNTLPAGLYFIQTKGEVTYKLVIQH